MFKKKRIAVLGATGSIGRSSIDIISRSAGNKANINFEIVLLSAKSSCSQLEELSRQFPSASCVLTERDGMDKLLSLLAELRPDITINGIAGAAGLQPSLAAIESGSDLALANKETIVMAGELVMRSAKEKNINIIPVDSEHSAIFQLLRRVESKNINETVSEIILTASGGPFKNLSFNEMEKATVKEALCHPTWNMGPKITIDSASMANKGLEIIEACCLFNLSPDKIKVVIHPQSIIHSMIRLCNGVIYAQMSKPDMRHPVHDALYWPDTVPSSLEPINFDSLSLEFHKPDIEKFPMLSLAWTSAKKGGLYPCAYNAANEIAAAAFLSEKIKFTDIPRITEHVLKSDWTGDCMSLEAIMQTDTDARKKAKSFLNRLNTCVV
ncbi:MAG: 1-deoxy-D-xylulose-5-phosphate reductoisomerase [Treponema sp.]|nr:1-deoxy-D-xylulose-5-phosphate reductoisomerase [Treponema sp.]